MFDLLFCPDSWRHCRQRYGVTSSGRLTAGCAARIAMRFAWATPTATATSAPSLVRPRRGAVPLTPTWLAMTRYGICNNGMWCPRFQMRVSKCMGRLPTVRTPTSFRRSIGCNVFMSRGASYTRLYYLRTLYRCIAVPLRVALHVCLDRAAPMIPFLVHMTRLLTLLHLLASPSVFVISRSSDISPRWGACYRCCTTCRHTRFALFCAIVL